MLSCPHFGMSSCCHVIISACHHVVISSYRHVVMQSCRHVVMSSCRHAVMQSSCLLQGLCSRDDRHLCGWGGGGLGQDQQTGSVVQALVPPPRGDLPGWPWDCHRIHSHPTLPPEAQQTNLLAHRYNRGLKVQGLVHCVALPFRLRTFRYPILDIKFSNNSNNYEFAEKIKNIKFRGPVMFVQTCGFPGPLAPWPDSCLAGSCPWTTSCSPWSRRPSSVGSWQTTSSCRTSYSP